MKLLFESELQPSDKIKTPLGDMDVAGDGPVIPSCVKQTISELGLTGEFGVAMNGNGLMLCGEDEDGELWSNEPHAFGDYRLFTEKEMQTKTIETAYEGDVYLVRFAPVAISIELYGEAEEVPAPEANREQAARSLLERVKEMMKYERGNVIEG